MPIHPGTSSKLDFVIVMLAEAVRLGAASPGDVQRVFIDTTVRLAEEGPALQPRRAATTATYREAFAKRNTGIPVDSYWEMVAAALAGDAAAYLDVLARQFGIGPEDAKYQTIQGILARGPGLGPLPLVPVLPPAPSSTRTRFRSLIRARNLVLEGVPGTGKTFAFQQLVTHWDALAAELDGVGPLAVDGVHAITFHPATTYEDFVEGIRPERSGTDEAVDFTAPPAQGTGRWAVEDGFFLRACRQAHETPDRSVLVLLDELNRANVPRVLGDLLTTLERSKRARHDGNRWVERAGGVVTLPTSKRRFYVPDNVFVVATMNTSDRSVSPLDAALRRRFAFQRIEPLKAWELAGIIAEKASGALGAGSSFEATDVTADPWWQHTLATWRDLNTALRKKLGEDAVLGHSPLLDLADDLVRWLPGQVVVPADRAGEDAGDGGLRWGEFDQDPRIAAFRSLWAQALLPQLAALLRSAGVEDLQSPTGRAVLTPLGSIAATLRASGEEGFLRMLAAGFSGAAFHAPEKPVAEPTPATATGE